MEDGFATLVRDVIVAHHIPGRIRLKLNETAVRALIDRKSAAPDLISVLQRMPGIRKVSINALARSCTVEYDRRVFEPQMWNALAQGNADGGGDALLAAFREAKNSHP